MTKRIDRPSTPSLRPRSTARPQHARGARGARGARQTQKSSEPEEAEFDHEHNLEGDEEARRLTMKAVAEKHDKDDGHDQGQQGQAKSQFNKRLMEQQQKEAAKLAQMRRDGFKAEAKPPAAAEHAKLEAPVAPQPPVRMMTGALHFLNNAKEPGELFERLDPDGHNAGGQGQGEGEPEALDPELLAAVEELAQKLTGVRGVTAVAPGRNDQGASVVLVMAEPGLTHASFDERIPSTVGRFETLVAIPFEALPLRRERWG